MLPVDCDRLWDGRAAELATPGPHAGLRCLPERWGGYWNNYGESGGSTTQELGDIVFSVVAGASEFEGD